jgi:hypothetical protein
MQLWQIDVMSGVLLDDDTELKLVTGVDDHSRFCVAAGLVTRATARAVCEVFSRAMKTYGIPDEVLTDSMARPSRDASAPTRPRFCSTASAVRTGYRIASPPRARRPQPARSSRTRARTL